jgi:hypothetical protein
MWMQRRMVWLCGYDGNAIIEWCDVNPATPVLDDGDDDSDNDINNVH